MNFLIGVTIDIGKYLGKENPWGDQLQNINNIIPGLINLILIAAGVIFFFLVLTAGIGWMTAGGDKEALQKAQKRLISALVGITIVFSTWAIINLVKNFFGLKP